MPRTEFGHEHENMIRKLAREEHLPNIDVTERVMQRIHHRSSSRPWRRLLSPMGAVMGMCVLLLVSATAYATAEFIQIRNAAGEVKVQYVSPESRPEAASGDDKFKKQVLAEAQPGELIAYYVKDKRVGGAKAAGEQASLKFAYKERKLEDYGAFVREMNRVDVPVMPEKIGEYLFDYGTVRPYYTVNSIDGDVSLYNRTVAELTARAQSEEGRLFMASIPWTRASSVSGIYSLEGAHIGIHAMMLYGADVKVQQEAENEAEVLELGSRTIIYNDVQKEHVQYRYLNWYNEEQDAYYSLTMDGGKTLTKEQLLKLAEELMNNGL
ncbi:hypothetical protein GNP94_14750 [Paenibacillus campinasensis]|uniref:DUF4367 domain-containing protein n=1 Tax=Paenibacillus campinasensis TaxID=66347 RepID=A0ABW9T6I6_9BACL|nr:hypothetical protein [Paenibacillus campinasensis]MUG67246.1 hypothetical protein [Paenibacillus campinasensis]